MYTNTVVCESYSAIIKAYLSFSTLFVLDFMAVWNDFTMPLYYLNNSKQWPMTLAVYNFFGAFENSWNLVAADIMLTFLPVLVI